MRECEERGSDGKLGQYDWNKCTHGLLFFLRKLSVVQLFPSTLTFAQFYLTNANPPN